MKEVKRIPLRQSMEEWTDDFGLKVKVHPETLCSGNCAIHNPSDHPMKTFPRIWRVDRNLMERICEHGVGHPDPDHIAFIESIYGSKTAGYESIHGCDGCCRYE